MKLIAAMKQQKDLAIKRDDLIKKIAQYCADQSHETPTYGADQRKQIDEWLQACGDLNVEILKLRIAVAKTNLATPVTIDLGGTSVTKTIAEWVHRRRDLAESDRLIYASLTDRGLREGIVKSSTGDAQEVKIRRYYDPRVKDQKVELYRSEPGIIDRTLETVNATTDCVE